MEGPGLELANLCWNTALPLTDCVSLKKSLGLLDPYFLLQEINHLCKSILECSLLAPYYIVLITKVWYYFQRWQFQRQQLSEKFFLVNCQMAEIRPKLCSVRKIFQSMNCVYSLQIQSNVYEYTFEAEYSVRSSVFCYLGGHAILIQVFWVALSHSIDCAVDRHLLSI